MSSDRPNIASLSGTMAALRLSSHDVIALVRTVIQESIDVLRPHCGTDAETFAGLIGEQCRRPLANAILAVKQSGIEEGRGESREALLAVSAALGAAIVANAAAGDRPELLPARRALAHAAAMLAAATPPDERPTALSPPPRPATAPRKTTPR